MVIFMQHLYMKKHIILLAAVLFLLIFSYKFLFCTPYATPSLTTFINLLTPDQMNLLDLNLYYSLPNYKHIRCYSLNNDVLTLLPMPFVNYTEGFMPLKKQQSILKTINTQMHLPTPLNYFYNYYEDNDYTIIAPIGQLSQIYFIKHDSHIVKVPMGNIMPAEKFYLNHILRKDNIYYLLGDLIGKYQGICCAIDATTLEVLSYTEFQTSPLTVYKEQSSLNAAGHIFFTVPGGLTHINRSCTSKEFIKLNFTPSYLISQGSQTVALHLNSNALQYAQLNASGPLINSGELLLPENNLSLIKATLQDEFLTLLTFSPAHPSYANYLLIYNLSSKQLVYCCALQRLTPYTALDFQAAQK